jgi:hypothetical protein
MEIDRWNIVFYTGIAVIILIGAYAICMLEVNTYQNGIPCNTTSDCDDFCMKFCISQRNDILKAYSPNCYDGIWGNVCGRCKCEYWEGWRPYERK